MPVTCKRGGVKLECNPALLLRTFQYFPVEILGRFPEAGGLSSVQRHCSDDPYQSILQVKGLTNRSTRSEFSCFLPLLQESLRLHKDSMPGLMDKDCSATFKFLPPCWNELLRSKTAHLDC